MSDRTLFLARVLGPYCLVLAAAMLLNRVAYVAAMQALLANPGLLLVTGVFTLLIGIALVVAHHRWSGGALTVTVTLVCWTTLLKGAALLLLPRDVMASVSSAGAQSLASPLLCLVVGLWFTVAGFRPATR